MNAHRYILQPYKGMNTRYRCPECNHRDKTFVRYVDTQTGEHLADHVGRCNRESNCGYHYTPKQYFEDSGKTFDIPRLNTHLKRIAAPAKPISFIPVNTFKHSLQSYESNHFVTYLLNLFDTATTKRIIETYFIGTSKYWPGATVFWQVDIQGKLRTGKIMLYSPATGKRIKEPFNHITWVHAALKQPEFVLKQCFFGEHLLRIEPQKPVAIAESEKTAVIASVYLPQFIWIATGGKNGCKWHNLEVAKVLQGRTVALFPDLNCFDTWSGKAKELSHLARFNVSGLLENNATCTERQQGLDLADYLIRFDYREFALPEPEQTEQPPTVQTKIEVLQPKPVAQISPCHKRETHNPKSWEREIKELQMFFETATLPTLPVKLNQCTTLTNVPLFIHSHLTSVKANNGKQTFLPYLHRLQELKKYIHLG